MSLILTLIGIALIVLGLYRMHQCKGAGDLQAFGASIGIALGGTGLVVFVWLAAVAERGIT